MCVKRCIKPQGREQGAQRLVFFSGFGTKHSAKADGIVKAPLYACSAQRILREYRADGLGQRLRNLRFLRGIERHESGHLHG